MKKKNIPRIIWITALFAFLITVLLMVMDYKINYQYSNTLTKTKLYFYNCDGEICTSESKKLNKELYSEYDCYTKCPEYKEKIEEDYVSLKTDEGYILYNYKTGAKIAEGYEKYKFINENYIIVTKNKLEGVIDIESNVTLNPSYTQVGYYKNNNLIGYNTSEIIVKYDKLYGIVNYKNGNVVQDIKYKESEINQLLELINK